MGEGKKASKMFDMKPQKNQLAAKRYGDKSRTGNSRAQNK